jgi:hypothetical protein
VSFYDSVRLFQKGTVYDGYLQELTKMCFMLGNLKHPIIRERVFIFFLKFSFFHLKFFSQKFLVHKRYKYFPVHHLDTFSKIRYTSFIMEKDVKKRYNMRGKEKKTHNVCTF